MPTWNDNLSTMPGQIASWMHHPDGKVQQSGRFETGTFTFGVFEGNISVGLAWQSRTNRRMDGFLYGKVDHYGIFTGDNITFIYPDFLTGLRGSFVHGVLHNATAVDVVAERCNNGVKELKIVHAKHNKDIIWEKEDTNLSFIGKNRKVMDPYERKSVYVGKSTKPKANEGLFARRTFLPGDIVSYYGGQKVLIEDTIFKNMSTEEVYEESAYHMTIGKEAKELFGYPENMRLDISKRYRSIVEYRTTLGHKANHSFENNVDYVAVDHPVLGGIACLVAVADIDVDEEVFARYKYGNTNLSWYNEELKKYINIDRCFARKKPC